jgi:NADPH:quinone reductase-like Zn-dependent oxidoreductase
MPSNQAAWLSAKSARPLEAKPAPYTPPEENEIVVKNGAVAVNPVDWLKQALGDLMFSWIKYPVILGSDLAGEVVEVGKGVTGFEAGDRVIGHAVGMDVRSNKSAEGAFQQYTIIRANLASPIPSSMPYENACVLPLCLSTAACALFQKDFLALQYPTVSPKPNGKTLLVWGGSTSVGSNAIQLAVAAGYEVITTASPKNFEYVKRLGAIEVFDYRSKTVVTDTIEALKNKQSSGAVAIGGGSAEACIDIIAASKGRKFVAQASVSLPEKMPSSMMEVISAVLSIVWFNVSIWFKSKAKRVGIKFIFGSDLMVNEVSRVIYEDYLPAALAEGKYVPAPEPQVVGKGLEYVQEAFDVQMTGVSAKKVVVSL